MATVYRTIYKGEFCNSFGDNIDITFDRRMDSASPVPIPIDIIFAGENQSPLRIIYKDDGDYKINSINGSEAVINIKAIGDFELSSMYTADEREWQVTVSGARKWNGYIIPDSCSEPFLSKPYDVTIRATDALGTLKDLPFQHSDGTKYRGRYREREVLRLALEKTGVSMDLLIAVNTFEADMNESLTTGALGQSYIDVARFLDADRVPFSCYDVIASILRRYSARLHQHNGLWQVVSMYEKSLGNVAANIYDRSAGGYSDSTTIGNTIAVGGQDREIHPLGDIKLAKAFLSSTGYYQYGYITNQLINGNFDDWASKPTGLADDWITVGTVDAEMGIRQVDGVDTTDYYLIVSGAGSGRVENTNSVQVRAGDRGQVSFDLYAPDAYGDNISDTDNRYLSVLIYDNLGKYYTNTGWTSTFGYYVIKYKNPSVFDKQIVIRFDITPQETDFTIKFGILAIGKGDGTHYATQINNVNIDSGLADAATKPPIGSIYREEQTVPQTYVQESILLLHADDPNSQRTSPITIYADETTVILPAATGTPSRVWHRPDLPLENLPIQYIATDNELRMHSRPYRVFDAEFVPTGFEEVDINSLLTVDLVEADFIFLSGEFDWKKDIHTLRFAEVLIDAVPYVSTYAEDYGQEKSGALVSSPVGASGGTGGSFVDLSGYAKTTDIPVKADDTETQTGTDDDKFITPLKLKSWWAFIKTQAATISGLWDFTTRPTYNSVDLITMPDIGTGWAIYTDTAHTSGSPLVVNSGVTSTITNNSATVINSNLPAGVTSWYDSGTSKIMPSLVGDSYTLNIRFTAVSSSNTGLADVILDVTGLGVIDAQTISLRKGAGSSQRINVVFDVYSLITFVTNGGIVKLNSLDGNTSVYDITYKITRVHKAI